MSAAAGGRQRRRPRRLPGVSRDDSDDELGTLDVPWKWIYGETTATPNRRNPTAKSASSSRIIGAELGQFRCFVGDCVLLKAEGLNEAWIAIICEFLEDDGDEKAAQFMWFSTEREIRNREKKRMDFFQNELYITPSWDVNPLAAINGKATVMSLDAFTQRYPNGKVPRSTKTFICRRGCNTRTATYTAEFRWEDIYRGPEKDVYRLIDFVKTYTKSTRKRRAIREGSSDIEVSNTIDDSDGPEEAINGARPDASTPRRKSRILTTPSSRKRILIKKTLEFTPLATRKLLATEVESSPFKLARSRLHVAAVPLSLPCREHEFSQVYGHLEVAIAEGSGSCIYIAGTPGTGKTATVREVINRLEQRVSCDELDDFIFVEINGMKITDPHQSYSLLWEALEGERVSPTQALELLEREFNNPSPRRTPCVVLMDELDQLVTKNQSVMYNFFNWPALRHSRLIVLAVANTMDLPERTLSNKISSRLGLTRITFPGYNHEQLMKIIQSRLEGVPGNIVEPDAAQFASRKVAAVSGDARRALDICRRAVELAENDLQTGPTTPSRKAAQLPVNGSIRCPKVTIATMKRAINEATSNPIQQYLRSLPATARVLLAAILLRMQGNGTGETTFGDVAKEVERMIKMGTGPSASSILESILGSASLDGTRPGTATVAADVMGLQACAVDLAGAGIIILEAHIPENPGKVRLAIGSEEIRMAFRDDTDLTALGIVI